MPKVIIILLVSLISFCRLNAQFPIMREDADSLVQVGANYIYNMRFDEAERCFNQVIKKYPEHPVGYFLDAMVDWWKITIYRNTNYFDKSFLNKIDKVIKVCDKKLEKDQFDVSTLFFKGGALGYRGRFHTNRKNWISAGRDGKEAYDILIRCLDIAPGNYDIMLGTGIYNYFAAAFPQQYPIIKPLLVFLPSGDKKIGILQLKAAAANARYASVEAKTVLLQIYYSFENNSNEALPIAEELWKKYPNNPYFERYLGRVFVRMGMLYDYERTWRDVLDKCFRKAAGYDNQTAREALYYIGTALYYRKDYENALQYFYKCDEACRKVDKEVTGFMVHTNLHIGHIFDLQGKRYYALKQYNKLLKMPDIDKSHEDAKRCLSSPFTR